MLNRKYIFMDAEKGSEDGAGGGISPDVQKLIDAQVAEQVSGLKAKNSELIGKLKAKGDQFDEFKSKFDGIDPDAVKIILSKFANDEEAGLIKAGKIDEVLNKRTERMRAEHDKVLKERETGLQRAETKASKLAQRALASAIKDAAAKAGAFPEALDDIFLRSQATWRLNDDGDPVALNGDEIVLGKDGKTALSPQEWVESLRETAPHFWPRAQGANAQGSKSDAVGKGQRKEPARKDYRSEIDYFKAQAQYHAQET